MSRGGDPRGRRSGCKVRSNSDPPREESLAFTGFGIDPRKVGAGSNASPHYFVRQTRETRRCRPNPRRAPSFLILEFDPGRGMVARMRLGPDMLVDTRRLQSLP